MGIIIGWDYVLFTVIAKGRAFLVAAHGAADARKTVEDVVGKSVDRIWVNNVEIPKEEWESRGEEEEDI